MIPLDLRIASYISSAAPLSERNGCFEMDQVRYVLHSLESDSELYMMQKVGEMGIGPKVVASFPEKKLAVIEYVSDSTITLQLGSRHTREIGVALKKAHGIPLFREKGSGFEGQNQVRWEYIQTRASFHDTELSRSLLVSAEKAMRIFEGGMKALSEYNSHVVVNLHTDLHPRNLFWTDKGLQIIDWESSSHGHPYFDLSSLSIFLALDEAQEKELLEGYFGRPATVEELREYALLKKIRWAYTSIVNAMWAYRLMEKNPALTLSEKRGEWVSYMHSFASTKGCPSLDYFVNVTYLSLEQAKL